MLAVIAFLARGGRSHFPSLLALTVVAAGFATATLKSVHIAHPVLQAPAGNVEIAGYVEVREERERSDRIVVRALKLEGARLDGEARSRARLGPQGHRAAGRQLVTFRARLNPPLAPLRPGGYDFARDLYFQRIGAVGFVLGAIKPSSSRPRRILASRSMPRASKASARCDQRAHPRGRSSAIRCAGRRIASATDHRQARRDLPGVT